MKHFFLKVQEYYSEREENYKFYGEIMRMQTAFNLNKNKPQNKHIKPERLWVFPWEQTETDIDHQLSELKKEEFEASYKAFLGLS